MPLTIPMPTTKRPRRPFNLVLSADEYRKLNELAAETGLSAAAVLRASLLTFHAMKIHGIPTCATGQTCFVPQMHAARIPSAAHTNPHTIGAE